MVQKKGATVKIHDAISTVLNEVDMKCQVRLIKPKSEQLSDKFKQKKIQTPPSGTEQLYGEYEQLYERRINTPYRQSRALDQRVWRCWKERKSSKERTTAVQEKAIRDALMTTTVNANGERHWRPKAKSVATATFFWFFRCFWAVYFWLLTLKKPADSFADKIWKMLLDNGFPPDQNCCPKTPRK